MTPYCTILLNPATKSDILAACIQAAAAISAGEAQAFAARQAGLFSFGAGIFALLAGFLAYRASQRQIAQIDDQRLARKAAYAAQICAVALRAREELIKVFLAFKTMRDNGPTTSLDGIYFTSIQLLRDELKPTNWENHALLGSEHLNQLAITYECLQSLLVEAQRSSALHLPHLDAYRGVLSAKSAKIQCEALIMAIANQAPAGMRDELKPVTLLSEDD